MASIPIGHDRETVCSTGRNSCHIAELGVSLFVERFALPRSFLAFSEEHLETLVVANPEPNSSALALGAREWARRKESYETNASWFTDPSFGDHFGAPDDRWSTC